MTRAALRLALVVFVLALAAVGATSAVTGLRGTTVDPPVVTQVQIPTGANGMQIEQRSAQEGSVSFLALGAVVLGLALVALVARPRRPTGPS